MQSPEVHSCYLVLALLGLLLTALLLFEAAGPLQPREGPAMSAARAGLHL